MFLTDQETEKVLNTINGKATFMVWGTESALPFICDNERVYENKIREQFSRTCAKHELNKDYYNPSDYFAVVSDFKPDVEQRLCLARIQRR